MHQTNPIGLIKLLYACMTLEVDFLEIRYIPTLLSLRFALRFRLELLE